MTDYIFPPHARISAEQLRYIANSVGERSIFTGAVRTTSRAGSRLAFGISTTNASDREDYSSKAALQALIGQLDGQSNRLLFADPGCVPRGVYPTGELLSNGAFADGATGWVEVNPVFTVNDRVARLTRAGSTGTVDTLSRSAAVTGLTQYAPYVARCFDVIGRGSWTPGVQLGSAAGDEDYGRYTASGGGMKTLAVVVPATSAHFGLVDYQVAPNIAGDYYEVPYTSFARCALVDAGANLLVRSDEFDNASWTKGLCTATANAIAGPDGTTIADALVDNGTSGTHRFIQAITVTTAAQDIHATFAVKAGSRNFSRIEFNTVTGSAGAFIDLTTGAVSTVAVATSFSNARAFAESLGNGWWKFSLVARKTSAETSVNVQVHSSNSGSTATYSGASDAALYVWRGTATPSGVPARQKLTSSVASTGETQVGNTLHLKGLPPSTVGLLLPGDRVQVGRQLNIVIAALNSDASGLGYLQCANRWRTNASGIGPVDNDPVIIHQPFGRFVMSGPETGWDQLPGGLSNYDLQIEEALDA